MAESVWNSRRPPRVELSSRRIRVVLGGAVIAETTSAHRVLETGHGPVYFVPLADVVPESLEPSAGPTTLCEWKGRASYYDVVGGDGLLVARGAWAYHHPRPRYEAIRDAVAFSPVSIDVYLESDVVESRR